MKHYDDIVVGSGISGMTLAILLGMNGHSVLLLEKSRRIGGSMRRFYKKGIPFDTGFHFTGGFHKNGILHDMLTVLGLHDRIESIPLSQEGGNRILFEAGREEYVLPHGYQNTISKLKEYFPADARAIDKYFERVKSVCTRTGAMDLRKLSFSANPIDEDYVSLEEVLCELTDNPKLRAIMALYSMCYGVKPAEISFANHSRVSYGLYESVDRVKGGGEAFIVALRDRLSKYDVDILCDRHIAECADIENRHVGRFVLNSGEELSCNHCIFTIHPKQVLNTLPMNHLSKAFVARVNAFEPSAGVFMVFGVVDGYDPRDRFDPTMLHLVPTTDMNQLIDPFYTDLPALVIIKGIEEANEEPHRVLTAFELSFPEHVAQWKNSTTGNRPAAYVEYKQERIRSITKRILGVYPEYVDSFRVIDAASILTFRDYLNSPDGSAYGVKQKIGQYNLFGKLPLRNVYAAGQSSVLPGLLGAMMSSFLVGRSIVGKEDYTQFIAQRLSH